MDLPSEMPSGTPIGPIAKETSVRAVAAKKKTEGASASRTAKRHRVRTRAPKLGEHNATIEGLPKVKARKG